MWAIKSEYELIDIGCGFFLVKFTCPYDLQFALEEGPWMIFGHYLTVRKWTPEFRPSIASIDSTAVWVQFPGLPIRYYNDRMLLSMGNTLGRALKVDQNTRFASKGRFARVCVEENLNKPLGPKICIDEVWQPVEYEFPEKKKECMQLFEDPYSNN